MYSMSLYFFQAKVAGIFNAMHCLGFKKLSNSGAKLKLQKQNKQKYNNEL